MVKNALVTGVSTGIGYGVAADLVGHGYRVFGSVRRGEDGRRVQGELGEGFTPLVFDVTDAAAVARAADQVRIAAGGDGLAALVNNAGVCVSGPLVHIAPDEVRRQLEVNVIGVLHVIQAFAPLLGIPRRSSPPPGRIVNISSVSGRVALPFVGPYTASKHALEALSDALRRELIPYGVDVVLIEPGAIHTPIWEKLPDLSCYRDTDYYRVLAHQCDKAATNYRRQRTLPVAAVSKVVRRALECKRAKTRYVVPYDRLREWLLPRWLPDRWFDWLVAREVFAR